MLNAGIMFGNIAATIAAAKQSPEEFVDGVIKEFTDIIRKQMQMILEKHGDAS
jgi:hypothetical protein